MKSPVSNNLFPRVVVNGLVLSLLLLGACSDGGTEQNTAVSSAAQSSITELVGDPKQGERIFGECEACHTLRPGEPHLIGPNLANIVGAPGASKEGFSYSTALKDAALTWDLETLDQFLANPTVYIPRSRMMYPGIPNAQYRADLIAYLSEETGQ